MLNLEQIKALNDLSSIIHGQISETMKKYNIELNEILDFAVIEAVKHLVMFEFTEYVNKTTKEDLPLILEMRIKERVYKILNSHLFDEIERSSRKMGGVE